MKKIFDYFLHPSNIVGWLMINKPHFFKNDKYFLKKKWKYMYGSELNINSPTTFNEKLNWLKINNRQPVITVMADKYAVKKFVANKIGEEYVVPCYGVWDSFGEIEFEKLPSQFVIKATHDSSGATVVRDKSTFDITTAKKKFDRIMKRNWFWPYREWAYKDIPPRIIADKYLDDQSGHELTDYKFWCFNGVPKLMYFTNKGKYIEENFYDMDFHVVNINHGYPRHTPEYSRPANFELMKSLCCKLLEGENLPFVRVDFFDVDNHVYFGEFTFYDWAGFRPFVDPKWEKDLGSWIQLPPIV